MFLLAFFLLATVYLLLPTSVFAHCPLCVAGAGVGLTLSRILGIDDTITGVWLGAFLGALAFWFSTSLGRRNKLFKNKISEFGLYIVFIALTVASFYQFNLIEKHIDIFGYDKLPFGMIIGGVGFYAVNKADIFFRRRDGRHFFPYQRIVVSLATMIVLSVFFYILLNFYI